MPELQCIRLTADCRRFARNVERLRGVILEIINNRRNGKTKSTHGDLDLLSILLQSELYSNDEAKTVDELILFFLAGNETIKTSSANTTCYLALYPDKKAKFMDEITPVLESFRGDYIAKMTIEAVEEFSYVRACWSEALRLQPPAPMSSMNSFSQNTCLKGVDFFTTDTYILNFNAIHTDPKEWREPHSFIPERFDPKSEVSKRPDGKPRSPFSFCPFFGGKRICLGKTLAEYMTVFTLPLVMFHFDFEFVNPEHVANKPNLQLATWKKPVIPMRVKTIRKINQQKI